MTSSKSRRPAKRWLVVGAALCLLAAGYGLWSWRRSRAQDDGDRLNTVTRKSISHSIEISGRIIPVSSLVIVPRQTGRIVDIAVQEGAQVKEGDLLFTLRLEAAGQTELLAKRAEVDKLALEFKAAEQRLQDKRPVRELIGSASVLKEETELAGLRLELEAARERLAVLESDLGLQGREGPASGRQTARKNETVYVTAPRPGIVTLIDKRPGDFVIGGAAGDASSTERMVMVVADMSSLLVRTRVLEADLRYVKNDLPVRVKLDAYPGTTYDGRVARIGGQGRTDAKAGYTYFDVDVAVEQQDARVLPEMNATVELIFAKRENVLTLPVASVAIFPDKALVRVPDSGNERGYVEKEIKVGVVNESEVEIVEGLAENDQVLEIDFSTLNLDGSPTDAGAIGGKDDKKPRKGRPGAAPGKQRRS